NLISSIGQAISHALSAIFGGDFVHDAARQQAFESVSQNVGGNAFGRGHEIFEPSAARKKIANDKQGPAVAKNVQRKRHRTGRALRGRTLFPDLISTANRHASTCHTFHLQSTSMLLAICKYYGTVMFEYDQLQMKGRGYEN